ncbi:hypothetical protein F5050DRAFT_1486659 [Lentinula boryana]|uniref:Uncharacterized protein n=1 Tax=Lentinula boryana TaxID=40481 RepID=A0ABQ8QEV8_9AGAR|nr:hypothetical protein F5050DRAFT_1486659 [Lentinula boryana]
MTEYDYSPEGYQRYLDTQRRISKWVQNTNAHASEFRSPFGIRSEVSSGVRTSTTSSKSKPRGDRVRVEEGTRTRTDDRGRRNSMADTTMRPSGSNAATSQRLPAYTPQLRHSYPYSPASREIHATDRTTTHHSHRRAQSLAPRSSQSQSQSQSQARTHHHTSSHPTTHGLDPPRRSSTLPAYVVGSPQQSTNTTSHRTHRTHSTHRLSSSHNHHHSHHHHSRSQSTPRPPSKLSSPLAVSPVYVANPGTYVVIPPRGRKVSVVYT